MLKIISIDLDGTLLKDNKTVSPETLTVLERVEESGKYVVINTGRPRHRAEEVLPEELKRYYWICSNGGDIFHGEKEIKKTVISKQEGYTLIETLIEEFKEIKFGVDLGTTSVTFKKDDIFYSQFNLKFQEFSTFEPTEIFSIFLSLEGVSKEVYREIVKKIPSSCRVMKTDLDLFATILPKDVSKFEAIKHLSESLGHSVENVLAFGDDINDLEILERVKWGVAMGNAVPKIKSVCKIHTKSNEEEGVRHYLENHILNETFNGRR